jgi:hypothetical protein
MSRCRLPLMSCSSNFIKISFGGARVPGLGIKDKPSTADSGQEKNYNP